MKVSSRGLIIVAIALVTVIALVAGVYIALGGTCESPFTRMRVIRAEFSQLPVDDAALKAWLLESPRVYKVIVQRDTNAIKIVMIVRASAPELVELPAELERLGYKGMKSYDPDYREPAP